MIATVVVWTISVLIGLMYVKSSGQKLRNPHALSLVIEGYNVFPRRTIHALTPLVSVLEVIAAIWLLLPWVRPYGALLGAGLQVVFLVLMIKNLGRTMPHGCGCFQLNQPKKVTGKHVLLNLGLLAALALVFALLYAERGDELWTIWA